MARAIVTPAAVTPLPTLFEDVNRARMRVQRSRMTGSPHPEVRVAQQVLLDALTTYGAALASRRLPLPPAMNREIRLYGSVLQPWLTSKSNAELPGG